METSAMSSERECVGDEHVDQKGDWDCFKGDIDHGLYVLSLDPFRIQMSRTLRFLGINAQKRRNYFDL